MEKKLPVQYTGKWLFQLQQERTLQFRIASEQETSSHVLIEGHEISELLDYLYDNRELIYDATHDQDMRHLESNEISENMLINKQKEHRVEPTRYFDNGARRIRANT